MKTIPFDVRYKDDILSGKYRCITDDGRMVRLIVFNPTVFPQYKRRVCAMVTDSNGFSRTMWYDNRGFGSDISSGHLLIVIEE